MKYNVLLVVVAVVAIGCDSEKGGSTAVVADSGLDAVLAVDVAEDTAVFQDTVQLEDVAVSEDAGSEVSDVAADVEPDSVSDVAIDSDGMEDVASADTSLDVVDDVAEDIAADVPEPEAWNVPECGTISGSGAITWTRDEGASWAPGPPLTGGFVYTFGLVAMEEPNLLIAAHHDRLLRSTDAGCTWETVGMTETLLHLVAADDTVYGWATNMGYIVRATTESIETIDAPTPNIMGMGVDALDKTRIRLIDKQGQILEKSSTLVRWQAQGVIPNPDFLSGNHAVFDAQDLDHAIFAQNVGGAWVTFDGGHVWRKSTGLTQEGGRFNAFRVVMSPSDSSIVWVMGIDISGGDRKGIWRSEDGGASFGLVLTDEDPDIVLTNGPIMVPHPVLTDLLYFVFGTCINRFGTNLYRYDHSTGMVTWNNLPFSEIGSIAFNPADPSVMYLGRNAENFALCQ